jgi:chromosome partitioning protein
VNAKGGSGKTTLACCLAAEISHRGKKVTLVDADPVGGASVWHQSGPLQEVRLLENPRESVARTIERNDGITIVDSAGFATQTMKAIMQAADVVVIPCRPSALDAVRAIETANLAREMKKRVLVVLNGVSRSAIAPHIRQELESAGMKVAKAEIHQRTAFAVAALNGTAPCWMGATARKAAEDISALADELI